MKPEEFNARTQDILKNLTDQATVSTILAELVTDYNNEATEKATAKTTAEKLTSDNEKLRQANMDLFLKLGSDKKPDENTTKPEDSTPKFEALFDKDGNLI
jgi:hypothetical protein